MPSERIQKRIDSLLDEADAAAESGDWQAVKERAQRVLVADPDNDDARVLIEMADVGAADQAVEPTPEETASTGAPDQMETPTS
ncbi:MAG: hypothetical protein IH961_08830, partial [Chloroflexi bacterium]|nr:hypothetical protein [Chloroflexota bacterium]